MTDVRSRVKLPKSFLAVNVSERHASDANQDDGCD